MIALLEDHARPDEKWCANIAVAHRAGYAAIGGAIENGIDRPLNWAVYYCDFGKYQNPLPSGESDFASDANTIQANALESVRALWDQSFAKSGQRRPDRRGEKWASPEIVVYKHRNGLRLYCCRER